jgi:hypothetical protein
MILILTEKKNVFLRAWPTNSQTPKSPVFPNIWESIPQARQWVWELALKKIKKKTPEGSAVDANISLHN